MSGKLSIVTGDATNPIGKGDKNIIIPHVVNSIGKWGSGFVLALNNAFGLGPRQSYLAWHGLGPGNNSSIHAKEMVREQIAKDHNVKIACHEKFEDFGLGSVQYVAVGDKVLIANMVGQHQVRGMDPTGRPPIRYGALAKAMNSVADFAILRAPKGTEIHAPKFGSDLAGGQWGVIEEMIREIWVDRGLSVTVYEWVG